MKKTKKILSLVLAVLMLMATVPFVIGTANSERWDIINAKNISGNDIVKQARTYLGVPYDTSGGNYKYRTGFGDTMMFDCSGFVYRVCRDVGLASSRKNYTMGQTDHEGKPLEGQDSNGNYYITAHTQEQRYYGEDISASVKKYIDTGDYSELQAGDLLFITNNNSSVSHVVIYSGEGTIVHSEGYQGCVSEHPINRYHINNNKSNWYFAGCRLVKKGTTIYNKVEFNGHYYQVFDESLDWYAAKARCEEMGGHLVTITSAEEQGIINNMLLVGNKNTYWIGGYKSGSSFEWITDEKMSYTNWSWGQPDNHDNNGENVLQVYKNINPPAANKLGQWNDLLSNGFCNEGDVFFGLENIGFICEWETNPDKPTEPSTPDEPTPEPSTPDEPDEPKNEGNIFTKIIEAIKNLFNKIFSIFKW